VLPVPQVFHDDIVGATSRPLLPFYCPFRRETRFAMIDEMTEERIRVSTDGVAGPYLMLSMTKLGHVCQQLDKHAIRYWVDADAISLDGKPPIAVINFGRAGDAASIQTILDKAD
jgi:hypothetical protein